MQRDPKKEKGHEKEEFELEQIDLEAPSSAKSRSYHQHNGEVIEQNEDAYFGGPNLEVTIRLGEISYRANFFFF